MYAKTYPLAKIVKLFGFKPGELMLEYSDKLIETTAYAGNNGTKALKIYLPKKILEKWPS